jgi:hypothetical protein
MVSTGYTDLGEEWSQKLTWRSDLISRDTSIEMLLYEDSTDQLDDTSDVGDITTELSGGGYSRQALQLDSQDITLNQTFGNMRVRGTATFDLEATVGSFDAYGLVVEFASDIVLSESQPSEHLIATATLDGGPYAAGNFTTFGVQFRGDLD